MLIAQSGLELSVSQVLDDIAVAGAILAARCLFFGAAVVSLPVSGFVGFLGLPRWFLGFLRKRRQETFLTELPDAIDVMVRGLKAGLAAIRRHEGHCSRDAPADRA